MKILLRRFAYIAPGRAYRYEATDASHDCMFMQIEGLVVGKDISMANLLATLKLFLEKNSFKKKTIEYTCKNRDFFLC